MVFARIAPISFPKKRVRRNHKGDCPSMRSNREQIGKSLRRTRGCLSRTHLMQAAPKLSG